MKLIRRILLGVIVVVVALVVLVVGAVVVDGVMGGARLDALTNTRLPNANGPEVRAYVARPSTPGPHPAVIMIHEFWGLRDDIVGKAEALAEEGYLVVAPDMFRGSTASWVPRAIYQVVTTPPEQINTDLDAVFAWLATQPEVQADRIGIMGFCFGGRTSLLYSLHNDRLAATVILYGSLITEAEQLKALPGPVLGIFGGADNSIPVEEVRAFESALTVAGVPNEVTIYEGQPHAFVTSIEAIRQGGVQGQAWAQVLSFFKQNLQTAPTTRRVTPSEVMASPDWGYWLMLAYEHTFGYGAHQH
jgi:carboxymethylenebutenolidase